MLNFILLTIKEIILSTFQVNLREKLILTSLT